MGMGREESNDERTSERKRTRIPVRCSVVMMVEGAPKTEASAKDVPLDCALAESLKRFREGSTYNQHIGCSRHPG